MRTFLLVTGPKVDLWLVKTVGALVTVIGAVIGLAGIRRQRSPEIALLAIGSAATLTGIDVYYVAKRRISRVYLLDAVGETVLILAWLWALAKPSHQER
jgi:high-affinity nickel permease